MAETCLKRVIILAVLSDAATVVTQNSRTALLTLFMAKRKIGHAKQTESRHLTRTHSQPSARDGCTLAFTTPL